MAKYVYIVEYDLKRRFGGSRLTPICVYDTFESAKKRVDQIFSENVRDMKANLTDEEYTFEEHKQAWKKAELESSEEGWCYTRQILAKCDTSARMFGDEVSDDLQVSVIKIEFHPE